MLIIGERINTVRRIIAKAVHTRDAETVQNEAVDQVKAGVHALDINLGSTLNEAENMRWAVKVLREVVNIPVCMDDIGIPPNSLYIDCLVEPISVGQGKVRETLTAIRMLKNTFSRNKDSDVPRCG